MYISDEMLQKWFQQIAERDGSTPEQVRTEMQAALTMAWNKPDKTETERRAQAKVPCKGPVPTPEEYIRYAAAQVRNGQGGK